MAADSATTLQPTGENATSLTVRRPHIPINSRRTTTSDLQIAMVLQDARQKLKQVPFAGTKRLSAAMCIPLKSIPRSTVKTVTLYEIHHRVLVS